ncbi:MAG: acetate--CoA ligase family protein [Acidimicrobiales bacterium]
MANTLSEVESKLLLSAYGAPFADERQVSSPDQAAEAGAALSYPVVAKLCGDGIAHKTERGLVRLGLNDEASLREATSELLAAARPEDGDVTVLVAPQIRGDRELIVGIHRDDQLGMTVMVGIGGVLSEMVADVSFRVTPIQLIDAEEMLDELAAKAIFGPFRGQAEVDRSALIKVLCGLSDCAQSVPGLVSAELNPLIVTTTGDLVAVDALVEMSTAEEMAASIESPDADRMPLDPMRMDPLFNPAGVIVAGASTHPGKFGFVALHNILASGYEGKVFATNRNGAEVLGIKCVTSVEDIPQGQADLVVLCTPTSANPDLLRACAAKGIRAAFVTSAGYGEADDNGRLAEAELVALADELGIALAGPNGQGLVSTPAGLCAQIVAPYPPSGHIGVASQSGNLVSTFMNLSVQTGVGISRAVSAGNAAALGVLDYIEYFVEDAETKVGLAYLEGFNAGPSGVQRLGAAARKMPLVVLTGGTSPAGQRAAASHTGSLASNNKVFDGMCHQMGIVHAITVEEAYEAAATFASQPLPRGPRVAVVTTAGGWGVVTADALSRSSLELVDLPGDLCAAIDEKLPPRWSKSNPIDLAGGETRDTVPEILELVARHPAVDAVIFLGLGIQSNQARLMRRGRYYPEHGIERIVAYHERQDIRYAQAAAAVSEATGKPVLLATELAVAVPDNPGVQAVRETGRLCYTSSHRAVMALDHMWTHARWRQRRPDVTSK